MSAALDPVAAEGEALAREFIGQGADNWLACHLRACVADFEARTRGASDPTLRELLLYDAMCRIAAARTTRGAREAAAVAVCSWNRGGPLSDIDTDCVAIIERAVALGRSGGGPGRAPPARLVKS